ncbi:hypothetical protein BASA81_010194 [Batrachochytrium salamandrivorans]|nr:hypothetical protein BASA81_010194 [Batrachochytrium salamandrivorans]
MKFNALVVAAMVIASVNASGADEPPSGAEYSGGRSNTELIQGSSGNGPGKSRESGVTEYDPKYAGLLQTNEGEDMRRRKIKKRKLKSKQTVTYLALSDEHKAKLKEIKAEYADVTKEYDETWEELIAKEGSAESLGVAPLEEMIERGHFLQWQDEIDADISNRQ